MGGGGQYLEEDRRRVAVAAKEARASRRKDERQLKEYVHTIEVHLDQVRIVQSRVAGALHPWYTRRLDSQCSVGGMVVCLGIMGLRGLCTHDSACHCHDH